MTETQSEDRATASTQTTGYPPAEHIVRDLQVAIDRARGEWEVRLPIVPEIADATGRPRVGVAAVIADMIAGQTAIRAVAPSWIATSNLALQVGELPRTGTLVGRPSVLRRGATTIVIEVDLRDGERDVAVGLSTLGFSILPRRNELQAELQRSREEGGDTVYAPTGHRFEKPLLEAIGLRCAEGDPSTAEVALVPYLQNTLGALQGGVVGILVEATAERWAASVLGAPVRVRGLELHYLKLGRVGPIRARARTLASTAGGLIVRVALDDRNQGSETLTVATVWVERAE